MNINSCDSCSMSGSKFITYMKWNEMTISQKIGYCVQKIFNGICNGIYNGCNCIIKVLRFCRIDKGLHLLGTGIEKLTYNTWCLGNKIFSKLWKPVKPLFVNGATKWVFTKAIPNFYTTVTDAIGKVFTCMKKPVSHVKLPRTTINRMSCCPSCKCPDFVKGLVKKLCNNLGGFCDGLFAVVEKEDDDDEESQPQAAVDIH